ncbi:hypothetical protein HDU76_002299, partial [Blyttiomyces sp. JEL0837]
MDTKKAALDIEMNKVVHDSGYASMNREQKLEHPRHEKLGSNETFTEEETTPENDQYPQTRAVEKFSQFDRPKIVLSQHSLTETVATIDDEDPTAAPSLSTPTVETLSLAVPPPTSRTKQKLDLTLPGVLIWTHAWINSDKPNPEWAAKWRQYLTCMHSDITSQVGLILHNCDATIYAASLSASRLRKIIDKVLNINNGLSPDETEAYESSTLCQRSLTRRSTTLSTGVRSSQGLLRRCSRIHEHLVTGSFRLQGVTENVLELIREALESVGSWLAGYSNHSICVIDIKNAVASVTSEVEACKELVNESWSAVREVEQKIKDMQTL